MTAKAPLWHISVRDVIGRDGLRGHGRRVRGASMKVMFEPELSADVRQRIERGVDFHNLAATRRPDFDFIHCVLRDDDGAVRGGLLGELWGGWLHVSYLWVDTPLRHRAWATELLRAAEHQAVVRGAHDACLETFSFQARPFYERHGYTVFATLEDYPPGHQKFFLRKKLEGRAPARPRPAGKRR
jgi:ribosomal protein S18 acetylase RimI-like enzyme